MGESEWLETAMELAWNAVKADRECWLGENLPEDHPLYVRLGTCQAALRAHLSLRAVPQGDVAEPVAVPEWKMPSEPGLMTFINGTPLVMSLLYDINLMPEQITDGRRWDYMVAVCEHMRAALAKHAEITQLAATPPDRESLLLAKDALEKAVAALEGGLWDYGPGQDEHAKCDEVLAECREVLAALEAK